MAKRPQALSSAQVSKVYIYNSRSAYASRWSHRDVRATLITVFLSDFGIIPSSEQV
jgi:hypothetical protein